MDQLFLAVLNMSLTASFVIIAIILVRLPLKKAPKAISYALWAVAGFRLLFPFSFESAFSLIPFKSAPIPTNIAMHPIPRVDSGIRIVDNAVSPLLPVATPAASVNPLQIWLTIGAYLWLIGIAVMLIYSIVSIILLKRRLHGAILVGDNIYEADNLKTPFVLGIFRPKVYVPAGLMEEEKNYIILHEQIHIRRHDHVVKFLAYFILCLHWFNPLVWAAFLLMGVDMEMSCDERVLQAAGGDTKKAYSMSLLSLATGRRIISGSPLAFGEGGMKERIKNVLNFKKPSRVMIIAAVAFVAILGVGLTANRVTDPMKAITLNEIRELAQKDDGLTFEDFKDFKGADVSSNTAYHIMLYGVEDGYRLIVRTDGKQIDSANLESVWESGGSGIDIRYGNVEEFIKSYPSSKANSVTFFVTTSPDKYTPAMSSTPGIRLDITYKGPVAQILYEAETGGFLTWESSVIRDLGDSVTRPADASALYWRPNLDAEEDDVITITALDDAGRKIAGSTFAIANEDGFFRAFTKSPAGMNADPIEAAAAKWSPDMQVGADMVHLDYASGDTVIFHDYFGLFVYDLDSQRIARSLDLKPIGCAATQGDDYCEVTVSKDGNTVQLHPLSQVNMYVYTVSDNTLREMPYERMAERFTEFVDIVDVLGHLKVSSYSHQAVRFDTGEYGYLHTSDWTLGTLSYVRDGDMMYRLFGLDN